MGVQATNTFMDAHMPQAMFRAITARAAILRYNQFHDDLDVCGLSVYRNGLMKKILEYREHILHLAKVSPLA